MKFLLLQLKDFFTNRFGLIAVFANLVLAILGLAEKEWNYGIFHYYYEPSPIKIIFTMNLPVISFVASISRLLFPVPPSPWSYVKISSFEMMLIVIFSIFQWLLIGYVCHLIFQFIHNERKARN